MSEIFSSALLGLGSVLLGIGLQLYLRSYRPGRGEL